MAPHTRQPGIPVLDGDGHGGRAVITAEDRILLDVEECNRLLEAHDMPPIEPDGDGVITLDSAGQWRYRPTDIPDRRRPTRRVYERLPHS